jgi:calcineurin-like phosphoesterase family protein
MAAGRIFFTADWHLGDQRQDILGRPFSSAEEMHERLLGEHNALIAPEDTVYMIGDALHSSGAAAPELLGAFNGHLVLIRGNHDILDDSDYAPYVDEIIAEGEGLELDVEGVPCWLTHYPTQARGDRFNLVGHVHGAWRVQKNMLNVGVDAHHFRPITPERVAFYLKAIEGFYDEDVWCGQHLANAAHGDRSKPGRYLDQPRENPA